MAYCMAMVLMFLKVFRIDGIALQENAVRINTESTIFCWFQQIWKNNSEIKRFVLGESTE
jgi:hypothetical protein